MLPPGVQKIRQVSRQRPLGDRIAIGIDNVGMGYHIYLARSGGKKYSSCVVVVEVSVIAVHKHNLDKKKAPDIVVST